MKFWSQLLKQDDENFRFKSFMIELIVAYLADRGLALNDYPSALTKIFAFIANYDFETVIAFSDYYDPATCAATAAPVRIWDPVNSKNNV
ncbi:nucleotidyltransferase, partial [Rhizobium ruizarguesonis]